MGGFRAVFQGFGFIVTTPRSWPHALVPTLVLAVLAALFGALAVALVQPLIADAVSPRSSDGAWAALRSAFAFVLSWLAAALAWLLGVVVALAITPPLCSPALERIVTLQESALGVPTRAPSTFLGEIWCGLRAQAFAAVFLVPILVTLWIVDLIFPPAAFVTVPLKVIVTAFALAWNLFDYPLTLRDVRMRDRFGFIASHKKETFGFGLAFAALFWIPCFGVLMLPVGAAAAARLIWTILDRDASALPTLERSRDRDPDLLAQREVPLARHEEQ